MAANHMTGPLLLQLLYVFIYSGHFSGGHSRLGRVPLKVAKRKALWDCLRNGTKLTHDELHILAECFARLSILAPVTTLV